MRIWLAVTVALLSSTRPLNASKGTRHAAVSQCGVSPSKTKIVGGHDVTSLKFPWYVALVVPDSGTPISVSCGGSLITHRHVLSAAHCFPKMSGVRPEQLYRAVLGLVNRCDQKDIQSYAIARVDVYPSFNLETLQGDVAVITLQRAISYTPICLPYKDSKVRGESTIIGFGSTLVKASSPYPCVLQEAEVTALTRRQCQRSGLESKYANLPGTFCAGLLRGGVDSCDGDSGGPLQTVSNGVYTVQGIVSFGEGCARKNLPGVYTQVSHYRDFIDRVIHSDEDGGVGGSGDGEGVEHIPVDEPLVPLPVDKPLPSLSTLLHELLQGLIEPWTHSATPDSSSGGRQGSSSRPLTPFQNFLHSIFGADRWRPREARLS